MRVNVDSSLLIWLDYTAAENRLRLAFHSGDVYDFFRVPHWVHQELLTAPSKGRYFNQNIRNDFPHQRLQRLAAT
jgi:hypothetical protein